MPKLTEFSFLNWDGGGGHIGFSPVSPTRARTLKQYRMVSGRVREYGFDYMGLIAIGLRELHHVTVMVYDQTESGRAQEAGRAVSACWCAKPRREGYGEYRTHIHYMDMIAGTYNWNDNALMKMNQTIKDALDPNGILAPGKSGIWPKHLREGKRP